MTDTTTRIPHDGGACPVSPGAKVTVWFRDGTSNALLSAKHWRWVNSGPKDDDIVSYAILEPDWAVEGPKLAEALTLCIPIIDHARESLVQSYCTPPRKGEEYDIETIDERWVYKQVTAIDVALDRARTALSRIKGEEG